MNPNPHDLGRLTFENSTRFQLRTLNCTYDGFCTGEGGPALSTPTNYIPEDKLKKKERQKEHIQFASEGFTGKKPEQMKNNGNTSSDGFSIPRATAESMATEHLTMRQRRNK